MAAPVCNIQGTVQPPSASLPGLQPIPKATDLQSALKAIQALTNNFNYLLSAPGNFTENPNLRTYKTVRVFQPGNSAVYVDVQQITSMTLVNPLTGQTIKWTQ